MNRARWTALLGGVAFAACAFTEQGRSDRLREMYPQGTARADVIARFKAEPKISELRPAAGWVALPKPYLAERVAGAEQRVGRSPARLDVYVAYPDGVFSLCNVWFYYDENDRVLDTEWQYHSD